MISSHLISTTGFILLAVPAGVALALIRSWRQGDGAWRLVVRVAFAAYAAILVGLVFFPLPLPPWQIPGFDAGPRLDPWPLPWANLRPFATIGPSLGLGPDWPQFWILLGNIAAFVPLGVFVGVGWPRRHAWRRAFAVGLATSVAIECGQLGLSLLMGYPYRAADIDDVIVNVAGALLGYGVFRLADLVARAWLPQRFVFWTGPSH